MMYNTSADVAKNILDFVIENGRVADNGNGTFDRSSLIVEVEFEANERGITSEAAVGEIVDFALSHA